MSCPFALTDFEIFFLAKAKEINVMGKNYSKDDAFEYQSCVRQKYNLPNFRVAWDDVKQDFLKEFYIPDFRNIFQEQTCL